MIEVNRASNAALENLRSEIVGYREDFNQARGANTERIQTLESQIKALGAKPEGDASEPEDIAKLRKHLEEQLNDLRVPRIISEEAYSRANGLISEIDQIIRDRQKKELLEKGPSPINPVYWRPAWVDVKEAAHSLTNEIVENLRSDVVRERIRERGLGIFALLVLSAILLIYGRYWSERGGDYLRQLGGSGTGVWTFVISLLRIILPWVGVSAAVMAISLTGVVGLRGALLLENIPFWAAIVFFYDWIGRQIFLMGAAHDFKRLSAAKITELRIYIDLLAVMLILHELANLFRAD